MIFFSPGPRTTTKQTKLYKTRLYHKDTLFIQGLGLRVELDTAVLNRQLRFGSGKQGKQILNYFFFLFT